MYLPSSTYRLQFNRQFNFKNLNQLISYFNSLNPGAIYASPIFRSVPESNHGYDVTDPLQFNPEIGNLDEFLKLNGELRKIGIGWIQDIVPNHMAFHPQNEWLMDVLKYGKHSDYSSFFDIDWDHPEFKNKVLIPVLDDSAENCIKNGKIALLVENNNYFIQYGDFRLPVNPESMEEYQGNSKSMIDHDLVLNNDNNLLRGLLLKQHYVLAHWQAVDKALNYRRFFTINGLISLRIEDSVVFEKYHELIFKLLDDSHFTGIRLDHIDGLKKPVDYIKKFRSRTGENVYIVAEKIYQVSENFNKYWPIQGTTGYDFLAMVNGLFTGTGISELTGFYCGITGMKAEVNELIYEKKSEVLNSSFSGDLDNICRQIKRSGIFNQQDSITAANLKAAIGEFLVCCPVYKLYSEDLPLNESDRHEVIGIINKAIHKKPHLKSLLNALKDILTSANRGDEPGVRDLFLRMMQFTGPLMAKGIEDTAMYIWAALIARNEVGDSMAAPVLSTDEFHSKMIYRRNSLPASMNATATHDTKRGEDSRARLLVISDIPYEWIRFYKKWSGSDKKYISRIGQKNIPDENEKYFICQVILGALPMDGKADASFIARIEEYLRKALREAKTHTNWNNPDITYENAVISYAKGILKDTVLPEIAKPTFHKLRDFGIVNSLSQLVLKSMCPGIPDFYQGTEYWDLSFVDPDNRRIVDYEERQRSLKKLHSQFKSTPDSFFASLYKKRINSEVKLWITHRLMSERFSDPKGFVYAGYIPLDVSGNLKKNILTFARVTGSVWYLAIIPLHLASLKEKDLSGTVTIRLPLHAPKQWISLWDDKLTVSHEGNLIVGSLPFLCPLVLKGTTTEAKRGSGMLMHITSLPGNFGTGSLGQEAYDFVNLLKKSGQKYWQILPFNQSGNHYSPYSSPSAFAGNMLFIDPGILFSRNYVTKLPVSFKPGEKANFSEGMALRTKLFDEAYDTFKNLNRSFDRKDFESFCSENEYWLNDFALFSVIRRKINSNWNSWPIALKHRRRNALDAFKNKNSNDIEKIKFIQYLFHQQFSELKAYAQSHEISIIGDLPIYVSYNSSDVWANPGLFNLDDKLNMVTVAGVPPDFFSKSGQLWNLPIYNWKVMKELGFEWWKLRIKRNMNYCDLVRFDHFRALSSYWEIPAGCKTAIEGKWTPGPGPAFLNAMRRQFPDLPFIAEDLGDIDDDVLKLRDRFKLPGMKVLMFAFGESVPDSFHIPHNYPVNSVVYTGTHDNNTVNGWYKNAGRAERGRISEYLGRPPGSKISWEMIRLALTSVSKISIIPVQDVLSLDEYARLNTPSRVKGNWLWKIKDYDDLAEAMERLFRLTYYTGRI
jgi:malto-oligosyltrehalose synthase/4-alpha-glucanotransferase